MEGKYTMNKALQEGQPTAVVQERKSQAPPPKRLWQTAIRESVTPLLPPPVSRGIVQQWDPVLKPYVGPEGTVNITATLVLAWLFWWVGTRLFHRSGRAVSDDNDQVLLSTKSTAKDDFDATVVFIGPRQAGKTRLFYQLCYSEGNLPTLMSLKANVGIAPDTRIRYVDWPGHASVNDPALVSVLTSKKDVRIVIVMDATQPVSAAADNLYQLLNLLHSKKTKTTIFVACHKKDFPKAKNDRRIKIQLRTELERILAAKTALGEPAAWCSAQPLELDELSFVKLHFCATTCEGSGSPELMTFCQTGVVADAKS